MSKFKSKLTLLILLSGITQACEVSRPDADESEPLNVIFMIGDGMGLTQVSTAFYFKGSPSNFERFKSMGLIKTSSASHKVTDSAAGATAFSTGKKTYKRAIGVSVDTVALPTILEELEDRGYKTGLISLTSITHATPASFYAHVKDRDLHEEIAAFLPGSGVDFFAGGGLKFFNKRKDSRDIYTQLRSTGYLMDSTQLSDEVDPGNRYGFLLAQDGIPNKLEGRGSYLRDATTLALDYFTVAGKPFFMMIEGSYIDWGGHDRDAELLVQEVLDFDETIGVVLDYIATHKNTLVIVTADHETGGTALGKYYREDAATGKQTEVPDTLAVSFLTDQHTATAVPVFAKGPGEELFCGVYENNEIYHKLRRLIGERLTSE